MSKITSYRILIKRKRNNSILIWRHAWRWFPKNSYTKIPPNLFFLAFCGVICQNLLHRRLYTAVSSQKLLSHQFCEKPLHITFKTCFFMFLSWISLDTCVSCSVSSSVSRHVSCLMTVSWLVSYLRCANVAVS